MVQHSLRRPTHFALRLALIMVMMMVGGGHLTPVESQQEQAWQILNIQDILSNGSIETTLVDLASLCKESSSSNGDLLSCPHRELVYHQCTTVDQMCLLYRLDCDHQQIISFSMSPSKATTTLTNDQKLLIMKCKDKNENRGGCFGPWQLIRQLVNKFPITITNWSMFTAGVLIFVLAVFALVIFTFNHCLVTYL